MEKSEKYIAIIGDLVNSRELANRNDVQNALLQTLVSINSSDLQEHIAAKFVITLGDEFQRLVTRNFPLHTFLELYHSGLPATDATRFEEMKVKKFAEYYLIGTLSSFLLALVTGELAQYASRLIQ